MNTLEIFQPAIAAGIIGAAGGLLAAMRIDWEAFKAWNDYNDALTYNWRTASFRWLKGVLLGLTPGGLLAMAILKTILNGG